MGQFAPFPAPPRPDMKIGFPDRLREPVLGLAGAHLVCSVALTGVLILQAGRWWVAQKDIDVDADADFDADEAPAPAPVPEVPSPVVVEVKAA
jgi:hypothetical protein